MQHEFTVKAIVRYQIRVAKISFGKMASGGVNNNGNGPRLDDAKDITGTELLKLDLEKCPAWRVNSAKSDHRTVNIFLKQFWYKIGMFINDSAECLARLERILDVSEETRFMARMVNEYIFERQWQRERPCWFSVIEENLTLASWKHDEKVIKEFLKNTYDRNVCGSIIRYATLWYKRIKNIDRTQVVHENYLIGAIYEKLPEHFRTKSRSKYGRVYPRSLLEFCQWAGHYEAKYYTDEALGNYINGAAMMFANRTSPALEAARIDTKLFLDLEMCPPWRVYGSRSDHRSVIDFLHQFSSHIGRYIKDPARRLARFARILDASLETQFMVEPITEYIVQQQQSGKPCQFSIAEDILRQTFWNKYHQKGVRAAFEKTIRELDELRIQSTYASCDPLVDMFIERKLAH